MSETLRLDTPMIDWITQTSWDTHDWLDLINPEHSQPTSREGYKGEVNTLNTYFVGTGAQKNQAINERVAHRMVQASGAFADIAFEQLRDYESHDAKTTRIDVQITVEWHKADLFNVVRRWREKGRMGNFWESETGCTAYMGAWGSDRFVRVYRKSDELCRFEVCYKKAYAIPMFERLRECVSESERRVLMANWLRYELMRINDNVLSDVYGRVLREVGEKPPREARRPTTDTERWFRRVVVPALTKYVKSHDVSQELLWEIQEALDNDQYKLQE